MYVLLGVNSAVWLAWQSYPKFMSEHFLLSLYHLRKGRVYTLVTSAFSHVDGWHLAGNMLALYFFGRDLAYQFGGSKVRLAIGIQMPEGEGAL